jgi:uncharacterized protein (TIGR02996 family)
LTVVELIDEPREEELEAAIARDPYDVDAYAVYADWLQQHGHVRGELIAAQLAELRGQTDAAETREDLLALHARDLLGSLAHEKRLVMSWRCGFIHAAAAAAHGDDSCREVVRAIAALLAHPSGRLLVRLDVRIPDRADELVELLAAHAPPSLRDLHLATQAEVDLQALWPRCRRLRNISVEARACEVGELDLPLAEHAAFHQYAASRKCVRAVADASWPELVELDLWIGAGKADHADLRAMLYRDLPSLARLRVRAAAFAAAFANELAMSPLAAQLVLLDLSRSPTLVDEDVRTLARSKDRFPRLRELRLPEDIASERVQAWFAGTRVEVLGDSAEPSWCYAE